MILHLDSTVAADTDDDPCLLFSVSYDLPVRFIRLCYEALLEAIKENDNRCGTPLLAAVFTNSIEAI
jgi:hypothetical protein